MNETLTGMGQRIFSLRKKKGLTQEGLAIWQVSVTRPSRLRSLGTELSAPKIL